MCMYLYMSVYCTRGKGIVSNTRVHWLYWYQTMCMNMAIQHCLYSIAARDYVNQSAQTVHRSIAWSHDGGRTFSDPVFFAPTLPGNPVCISYLQVPISIRNITQPNQHKHAVLIKYLLS